MGENLIYIMYIFAIAGVGVLIWAGYRWLTQPRESLDLRDFTSTSIELRRSKLEKAKVYDDKVEKELNPPSEYKNEAKIKQAQALREQHKDQVIY